MSRDQATTLVFLRRNAVRRPLQQPYDGPYKVVQRAKKVYVLDINEKHQAVSTYCLKPAHLENIAVPVNSAASKVSWLQVHSRPFTHQILPQRTCVCFSFADSHFSTTTTSLGGGGEGGGSAITFLAASWRHGVGTLQHATSSNASDSAGAWIKIGKENI